MTRFEVTLSAETQRLIRRIERNVDPNRFIRSLVRFLERQASLAAAHVVDTQFGPERALQTRSGNLARSIAGMADQLGGFPAIRVGVFSGPSVAYAAIQEEGGVIRPVRARALAVPTAPPGSSVRSPTGSGEALTPAGVQRFGPREFPGELTFIPFPGRGSSRVVGGLFSEAELRRAQGDGLGSLRAAYLLYEEVEIPAKHYLRDGFSSYLPTLVEQLEDFLQETISGNA